MNRPNGHRELCVEELDARRLLAGDVTVILTEFGYDLVGDNEANSIRIKKIASRQFLVQGENGTTLNGEAVDLIIDGSLGEISLGGGDDSFSYDYGFPTLTEQAIRLDTGNGDDQVYLRVGGGAFIDTGNGDDTLQLDIDDAQAFFSAFRLNTGRGNDRVRVAVANSIETSTNIRSFFLDTGAGDDVVQFRGWLGSGFKFVALGAGDDVLIGDADAVIPYGKLAVSGGSGNDTVISAAYFGLLSDFENFDDEEES